MAVYTVLEPANAAGSATERAERFVFVRDGFSWGAFLVTPVWLIYRRLWIVVIGYVVVMAALHFGLRFAGVGAGGRVFAATLIALLVGFEAASLRRWTLLRRGWRELGTVLGHGIDDAERRFFDAWIETGSQGRGAAPVVASGQASHPFGHRSDVVGLFPEPGANR